MESFLGAVCVLAVIRFYYKISLVSDDLAVDYFFALYPFQQASISLHEQRRTEFKRRRRWMGLLGSYWYRTILVQFYRVYGLYLF